MDIVVAGAVSEVAKKMVKTIAKTEAVNTLRDGAVDFLKDKAKDLAGKEIADKIAALRSDATLRKQIQTALERAAARWGDDCPDRELVAVVAEDTKFIDLPSVQEALRRFAQRPLDLIAAETLQGKFKEVLPLRFEETRIERAITEFLGILREEFAALTNAEEAFGLFADPARIGNKRFWEEALERKHVRVDGHRLVKDEYIANVGISQ